MAFTFPGLSDEQCRRFEQLADMLDELNRVHNLTKITDRPEVVLRHFADSLQVLEVLASFEDDAWMRSPCGRLVDVGSGGGFPGLPIAIARPDWTVFSVDATGKKIHAQQVMAAKLGLENFAAVKARAEDLGHDEQARETFDVATARAVAHLRILAELCLPLVKLGGLFVAWKGPDVQTELAEARVTMELMGGRVQEVRTYTLSQMAGQIGQNLSGPDGTLSLIVIKKHAETDERYPRSFSMMKHRPLSEE